MKYTLFLIIITLRLIYHPVQNKKELPPFASPAPLPSSTISNFPAKQTGNNVFSKRTKNQVLFFLCNDMTKDENYSVYEGLPLFTYRSKTLAD